MSGGTQVADDSASSKRRILGAARSVFAEVGSGAARMDEIARRAGCNKALIYYYFGSKESLYDAVFAAEMDRNMPILDTVRDASFHAWLGGLVDATTGPDEQTWIRLIAREGLDARAPIVAESQRAQVWSECVQLLRRSQASGEIAPGLDPEMLVLMFLLSVVGSQTLRQLTELVTGETPDSPGFIERLRRFHLSLADQLRPHTD